MRLRMHAIYTNIPNNGKYGYTALCSKHVDGKQIAAFEDGVTCKNCLALIQWRKDHDRFGVEVVR